MSLLRRAALLLLVAEPAPIGAQVVVTLPPTQSATGSPTSFPGTFLINADGSIGAVGGVRESFKLASGNVPSAPVAVFGGSYILSQQCSSYGTLEFQVLAPDGTTWQVILSKQATDGGGGTALTLGSYARARVVLTGTSACSATLARVPA